jgi:quinol-cytochrome oxidoreductase complex cytochrome b subunit
MAEFKEISPNASAGAKLTNWFENRFPTAFDAYRVHMSEYYAPKNFNFWYYFGSLAMLVLALQIITGIFLTMNYKPDAALAFASVEYIMRDVPYGWLIRYMHSTGASAFFIVVYLHMFRGMMYGSYRQPRELTWLFGVGIFLCLMGEAFFGYLLPWGQMSFWGDQAGGHKHRALLKTGCAQHVRHDDDAVDHRQEGGQPGQQLLSHRAATLADGEIGIQKPAIAGAGRRLLRCHSSS